MRGLPEDFAAPICIVLHLPPSGTSVLPAILDRAGPLRAVAARDGEPLVAGCVYVAPADCHLLVAPGEVALSAGPRENGHRPAVDTLFRTAAQSYGPAVVGVVLSGALDDGAAGLAQIKAHGGTCIVQDPDDAMYRGMPDAALARVEADHVVGIRDLARLLVQLVDGGAGDVDPFTSALPDVLTPGPADDAPATGYICPECGGALWEVDEAGVKRYRCRIGHAYSTDSLVVEQGSAIEAALWTALRSLEERSGLLRRIGERAVMAGNRAVAASFERRAQDADRQAEIIRAGVLPMALGADDHDHDHEVPA